MDTMRSLALIALLSVSSIACTTFGAADEEKPTTEHNPSSPDNPSGPTNDQPGGDNGTDGEDGLPGGDPGTGGLPNNPGLTCESLAKLQPSGSFKNLSLSDGSFHINPIDVYVEEKVESVGSYHLRTLTIAFTETARECGYRENGIAPTTKNELRVIVERKSVDGPIVIDTGELGLSMSDDIWIEAEKGERQCATTKQGGESISTASSTNEAYGSIKITKRTATTIEGNFDVHDDSGDHLKGSFVAPICQTVAPAMPACCAAQ